jgi:hypothetical protein
MNASRELGTLKLEEVTSEIKAFTTAFISGLEHVGSGTFAVINGRHGILTAEHVCEAIHARSLSNPMISIIAAEGPHTFELPVRELVPHIALGYDPAGTKPDIQFLEIPAARLGAIRARKSFVNLGKDTVERCKFASSDMGFVMIAGFPAEFSPEPQKDPSGDVLVSIRGGFVSGLERRWTVGDFDFFETKGDRHAKGVPSDYGGVSGAGVWRVELKKKAGADISQSRIGRFVFMGVAFFQTFHDADTVFVRHNGPKTVYEALGRIVPQIKVSSGPVEP